MSVKDSTKLREIASMNKLLEQVLPQSGEVFLKSDIQLKLCQPRLMPLKSVTLEKLEKMQKEAIKQLHENKHTDE